MEAKGNIVDHECTIERSGDKVAECRSAGSACVTHMA
jgi:hypothetical protein